MYEISATAREAIRELCREYRVTELALFGSAVRPDFNATTSDLDMLVSFEPGAPIGFLEFAALQRRLSETLQRPVDLVPRSGLKQLIRDSVLSEARPIYAQ